MRECDARGKKRLQNQFDQTPGQLIAHAQQDCDTISSDVFLFSPFLASQEKPLLSGTQVDAQAPNVCESQMNSVNLTCLKLFNI